MSNAITHTWQLWQALKDSIPLPSALLPSPRATLLSRLNLWLPITLVAYYVGLSALFRGSSSSFTNWVALILPLMVLLFFISGTAFGVQWILLIRSTYRRANNHGLYEKIAVTPGGPQNALWSIVSTAVHQSTILVRLPSPESPFSSNAARAVAIVILLLMLFPIGRRALYPILMMIVGLGFVYIDYIQSCCVAMLIAVLSLQRPGFLSETWLLVWGYIILQTAIYSLMIGFVVWLLPALNMPGFWLGGVPHLLVFYFLREPLIALLNRITHMQPEVRMLPG